MKWAVIVVRTLVGLLFLFAGVAFFFLPEPGEQDSPADIPEVAKAFAGAMMPTGYMIVVKVLEATGGLLLLSGRLAPLGVVVLTPVAVNIALFDLLLVGKPALGVVLTVLCAFLIWYYRRHFAGVFAPAPVV